MTAVNDIGLVLSVLAAAEEPGYALVDETVYRCQSKEDLRPVPAAEAQAVRQLVGSGHLALGKGPHRYHHAGRLIEGHQVLPTKFGRSCRLRWSALQPLTGQDR
jgi:hypothetical protein